MAAAAARARVTGTGVPKGAECPPPLSSSPVSQIFVVGGGASELVVLVVVSGEHGGDSGQGRGWRFLRSTVPASGSHQRRLPTRPPLPAPSGRPVPRGLEMIPLPNGLHQECPDSKNQEQPSRCGSVVEQ